MHTHTIQFICRAYNYRDYRVFGPGCDKFGNRLRVHDDGHHIVSILVDAEHHPAILAALDAFLAAESAANTAWINAHMAKMEAHNA